MRQIAFVLVLAFTASAVQAQDEKKQVEKKKETQAPPLKVQGRPSVGARAALPPVEDGKEKNHELMERQGWVYLLDSRLSKDPKSSDPLGLWRLRNPGEPARNLWKAADEDGERILRNAVPAGAHGTDLISKQRFMDFDIHVEFRVPESSNSGVYLRGRYEIQLDSFSAEKTAKPGVGNLGAVYGVREPLINASRGPGQWQVLEATIRGFVIMNVRLNGDVIHSRVEVPENKRAGTGSQLGSADGESDDVDSPGPIFLQGDHGSVDFRNIRVRPRPAQIRRPALERDRPFDLKKDTVPAPDVKEAGEKKAK